MKTLFNQAALLLLSTCCVAHLYSQIYISPEMSLAYRTYSNNKTVLTQNKLTSFLNVQTGFKAGIMLTEASFKVPLLDNSNACITGIQSGPKITISQMLSAIPMPGIFYSFGGADKPTFTPGLTIRLMATTEDNQFYLQCSYTNHMASIGVGVIILENKRL